MPIQINPTTWKHVAKDDPKDRIEVIIGDDKQPDFYPQIKLERWDNEVNFSVRLKDNIGGTIKEEGDKIIYSKGNIDVEYYPYIEGEGGHKMVWSLKEKPVSNKVEFSLQSKGLDSFRQPPLTEEFQNGYSEEFKKEIVVSETQVKDLDGNVLMETPENVIGGYVLHYSGNPKNYIDGKLYRAGQFGIIYRIKLSDATGKWIWLEPNVDIKNGKYWIEIPQEFLDTAIYPIRANDLFGWDTAGPSAQYINADDVLYAKYAGGAGTYLKITARVDISSGTGNFKGVIATYSNRVILTNGIGAAAGVTTTEAWVDSVFSTSPTGAATDYDLGIVVDTTNILVKYTWVSAGYYAKQAANNYASPTSPLGTTIDRDKEKLSIYCTYDPVASSSSSSSLSSSSLSSSSSSSSFSSSSSSSSFSSSSSSSSSSFSSSSSSFSSSSSSSSSSFSSSSSSCSSSFSSSSSSLSSLSISSSSSSCSQDATKSYSKGDVAGLPADDSNLETAFVCVDYAKVALDDDIYVQQCATDEYSIFLFKNQGASSSSNIIVSWTGKSNRAPTSSTVYLQIYNRDTTTWETLDSDDAIAIDTEFTLNGTQTTNLSDYYDGSNWVAFRIYQEAK